MNYNLPDEAYVYYIDLIILNKFSEDEYTVRTPIIDKFENLGQLRYSSTFDRGMASFFKSIKINLTNEFKTL